MKATQLRYIYSEKTELERVKYSIARRIFFNEHDYKVYMPDGFSVNDKNFADLKKQINKEMKSKMIGIVKNEITKGWENNKSAIENFLNFMPYKKPGVITIQLTKYGVGGSYNLPSKIIININYKKSPLENVMHELIHLIIEKPIVQKYGLDHHRKEGLVDWIMTNEKNLKESFPNYKIQKISILPQKNFIQKINLNYY